MTAKPTVSLDWGETSGNITDPGSVKRKAGFAIGEKPIDSGQVNFAFKEPSSFCFWLNERMFDGGSADDFVIRPPTDDAGAALSMRSDLTASPGELKVESQDITILNSSNFIVETVTGAQAFRIESSGAEDDIYLETNTTGAILSFTDSSGQFTIGATVLPLDATIDLGADSAGNRFGEIHAEFLDVDGVCEADEFDPKASAFLPTASQLGNIFAQTTVTARGGNTNNSGATLTTIYYNVSTLTWNGGTNRYDIVFHQPMVTTDYCISVISLNPASSYTPTIHGKTINGFSIDFHDNNAGSFGQQSAFDFTCIGLG